MVVHRARTDWGGSNWRRGGRAGQLPGRECRRAHELGNGEAWYGQGSRSGVDQNLKEGRHRSRVWGSQHGGTVVTVNYGSSETEDREPR